VSFGEPILLFGLVLVPLAALTYMAMQGRKRREAATFANPALMPNLVTARPGMRRHLPPLLLMLALAAMVIALARPQRTVASPERAATVMMVTDISGSMNATDVEPNRITAAVNSAKRLTDELPETFRLGLVTFSDFAEQRAAPTTDRAVVKGALERLSAVGGTAMGLGLQRGLEAAMQPVANADGSGTSRLPAVLVLLSDGKDTQGGIAPTEVAQKARAAGIPIFAIALGTPDGEVEVRDSFGIPTRIQVPPDTETLKEIARISKGRFYEAADGAKLEEIYAGLGTRLSSKQVKEEVTVAFAGGALALLLLGGGLSMAWFGRPI
jgi:Ca-activated chloride channel family protein